MFLIIFTGLLGLVFGSFMNVLIYRIPRDKSIVRPSSFCRSCGRSLSWRDNIPLLSFILIGGRCRYCRSRISAVYPLAELLTAALFIALYMKFGWGILFFKYAVFVFIALAAAFTDLTTAVDKENFETGVIPSVYPFIGVASGLFFAAIEGNLTMSLAGCAAGYLVLFFPAAIYERIRGRQGLGEGDLYFFAMIGAFTGPVSIPVILTLAALLGLAAGAFVIASTGNRSYALPFAPMLAGAAIVYVFFESGFDIYNINLF